MAYVDNKNIRFNSFDGDILSRIKKVGNDQYLDISVDELRDLAEYNEGILPTTINALEIDWNSAIVKDIDNEDVEINSTGDLLRWNLDYFVN